MGKKHKTEINQSKRPGTTEPVARLIKKSSHDLKDNLIIFRDYFLEPVIVELRERLGSFFASPF